ncbi:ligase-associated DNA damage response endonuclease PdeM [Paracoccus liaowanqingii]|uniref:Ligase-associated DNA damage response endonuclease PdeM n=1 Tax=Paracoccus liaowanqingii TaxID=2560053 RepID=A0A4V1BID3_9RHOB|nr:ligase-associated DNA damage response endonuclease PdeM [Paracoccus liaowanqingii]QBX33285.1 ligase-associated DNA damage response endonuclease PdeM [Paracoccus liaowanqingii]
MTAHSFDFDGQRLEARASGALYWPARRWLVVADMHLGKSERMARRGGMLLPPYETQATLDRLQAEIAATDPLTVVSLGDAFDDDAAGRGLPDDICTRLRDMAQGRSWIWVSGNHDPGAICPRMPGTAVDELHDGLILRHEAGTGPDVSGHYHPCVRLAGQRRRCFLVGRDHLILPAFGAYTGGLPVDDRVLSALVPQGLAIACGSRALPVPVGEGLARRSARRA